MKKVLLAVSVAALAHSAQRLRLIYIVLPKRTGVS